MLKAFYLNEEETLVCRSDMPGAAIPVASDNKHYRDLVRRNITISGYAPAPTPGDVLSERRRRLAAGYEHDFGDDRGVHLLATGVDDMTGWDDLTRAALAAIALGQPEKSFTIVTETGTADVSAAEWAAIVDAMSDRRQAIWQASFALLSKKSIPKDFARNSRWG